MIKPKVFFDVLIGRDAYKGICNTFKELKVGIAVALENRANTKEIAGNAMAAYAIKDLIKVIAWCGGLLQLFSWVLS